MAAVADDMAEVLKEMDKFSLEDTYIFDKTALYWKTTPGKGLSHTQITSTTKVKARVTAALCRNAAGMDCLPVLLKGTAARSLAFRAAAVYVDAMDCQ
jgi:hypothetical protein